MKLSTDQQAYFRNSARTMTGPFKGMSAQELAEHHFGCKVESFTPTYVPTVLTPSEQKAEARRMRRQIEHQMRYER